MDSSTKMTIRNETEDFKLNVWGIGMGMFLSMQVDWEWIDQDDSIFPFIQLVLIEGNESFLQFTLFYELIKGDCFWKLVLKIQCLG